VGGQGERIEKRGEALFGGWGWASAKRTRAKQLSGANERGAARPGRKKKMQHGSFAGCFGPALGVGGSCGSAGLCSRKAGVNTSYRTETRTDGVLTRVGGWASLKNEQGRQ